MDFYNKGIERSYERLQKIDQAEKEEMASERRQSYISLLIAALFFNHPSALSLIGGLALGWGLASATIVWVVYVSNRRTHKIMNDAIETDNQLRAVAQRYKR